MLLIFSLLFSTTNGQDVSSCCTRYQHKISKIVHRSKSSNIPVEISKDTDVHTMYNMYNTNYLGQSYVMGLRNKASMNFEN